MGGLLSTPAPSPSTFVSLGLGSPAADADDGAVKSPAVDAPRRSLRMAGAPSPDTPAASSDSDGASSGTGGRRKGRPRVSARAATVAADASPDGAELGGDGGGGGGEVSASAGNVQGARMSLRSGSRLGKRAVEPDVHAEMGLGPDGGGAGSGDKVHDEMLHQCAEGTVKRRKGVSTRLADYVTDSESNSDDDFVLPAKQSASMLAGAADFVPDSESDREDFVLPGDHGMKVPANLFSPFNLTEPNVVAMGPRMTGEGSDGSVRAHKGKAGQVNDRDEHVGDMP